MGGLLELPANFNSADPNAVAALVQELDHVLRLSAPRGATTRLYILFALMAYGVVSGLAFLTITFIDYQRRANKIWMFRFVHRSNGTYIVGNQHVIFTTFGIISCLVLIGFAESSRRALILHQGMATAFYWRNLVYIPILVHGWVSSFANLQASILASERALNKQVLSPRVVNVVYTLGIVSILVIALTLDVFVARAWSDAWNRCESLRTSLSETSNAVFPSSLLGRQIASIQGRLDVFDRGETAVNCVYLVGAACCIFINLAGLSLLLILRRQIRFNSVRYADEAGDHAGMAERGIQSPPAVALPPHQDRKLSTASGGSKRTNSSRCSGTTNTSDLSKLSGTTAADSIEPLWRRGSDADPQCEAPPRRPTYISIPKDSPFERGFDPFARSNSAQPSPRRDSIVDPLSNSETPPPTAGLESRRDSAFSNCSAGTPPPRPGLERRQSLFHKVIFALAPNEEEDTEETEARSAEQAHEEKALKMATTSRLRAEVEKTEPDGAAQREWARHLLALKRVEWDLIVFIVAIVSLGVVLFCVSVWVAITPSSIYRSSIKIEVSLFLFPWIYLIVIALAHTSLLYNAFLHLTPITAVSVPVHGVFLPSARAKLRRESIDGLSNDSDFGPTDWSILLKLPMGRRFSSASQVEGSKAKVGIEEDEDGGSLDEGAKGMRRWVRRMSSMP